MKMCARARLILDALSRNENDGRHQQGHNAKKKDRGKKKRKEKKVKKRREVGRK